MMKYKVFKTSIISADLTATTKFIYKARFNTSPPSTYVSGISSITWITRSDVLFIPALVNKLWHFGHS